MVQRRRSIYEIKSSTTIILSNVNFIVHLSQFYTLYYFRNLKFESNANKTSMRTSKNTYIRYLTQHWPHIIWFVFKVFISKIAPTEYWLN